MSKQQVNPRLPGDLYGDIDEYADEYDVSEAEATRQLLRQGADRWRDETPGETLMRQATAISVVLAVISGLLLLVPGGPAWSLGAASAGMGSTLIFGVLWLGVRALAGRGEWG
jgi:hypothetical protein